MEFEEIRPVWLTRDSFRGELDPVVDVWRERPARVGEDGRATVWLHDMTAHVGSWYVDEFAPGVTLPETARECVRHG